MRTWLPVLLQNHRPTHTLPLPPDGKISIRFTGVDESGGRREVRATVRYESRTELGKAYGQMTRFVVSRSICLWRHASVDGVTNILVSMLWVVM